MLTSASFSFVMGALSHARPASSRGNGFVVDTLLAIVGLALLVGVFSAIDFVRDLRAREGLHFFRRRSILRSGVAANATILSSSRLEVKGSTTGSGYFSNVYEVAGADGATFRAKGIEEMPDESSAALKVGELVAVRYDPVDRTVVMVSPFQKRFDRTRDQERERAERARAEADAQKAAEQAQREKEARLLRGDPPG